ncbi:ankyrin repeat-containing domain protein [Trichoderma chlorosporum]
MFKISNFLVDSHHRHTQQTVSQLNAMMEHIPEPSESIEEETDHPSSEIVPSASQESQPSGSTKPVMGNLPYEVIALIVESMDTYADILNFCLTSKANHEDFFGCFFQHNVRFDECWALPFAIKNNMVDLAIRILKVPLIGEFAPKRVWHKSLKKAQRKNHLYLAKLLFDIQAVQDCIKDASKIMTKREPRSRSDEDYVQGDEELLLQPMFDAAEQGQLEFVRLYLRHVNVNVHDGTGNWTALHSAALGGQLHVVKALVEEYEADPNIHNDKTRDDDTLRPIELAAEASCWKAVELFLSKGMNHCFDGSAVSLPLLFAVQAGRASLVKRLLQDGSVDPNERHNVNLRERGPLGTPLERAVRCQKDEIVRLLLSDSRVDPNRRGHGGRTPLLLARISPYHHNQVLCTLLEDERVDTNAQDEDGCNALSWAVLNADCWTAKVLLDSGKVDPDHRNHLGQTPVFLAASGDDEILKLLVDDERVDLNIADQNGRTPLCEAAEKGNISNAEILLRSRRVDLDREEDKLHRKLMMEACRQKNYYVAKLLLDKGRVDINKSDIHGRTPLKHSINGCPCGCDKHAPNRVRIAEMLLKTGRVLLEARDCQEILEFAVKHGSEDMVKMMLETGRVHATAEMLEDCQFDSITTLLTQPRDVHYLATWYGSCKRYLEDTMALLTSP